MAAAFLAFLKAKLDSLRGIPARPPTSYSCGACGATVLVHPPTPPARTCACCEGTPIIANLSAVARGIGGATSGRAR